MTEIELPVELEPYRDDIVRNAHYLRYYLTRCPVCELYHAWRHGLECYACGRWIPGRGNSPQSCASWLESLNYARDSLMGVWICLDCARPEL